MKEKTFFHTKAGHQTLAGFITISSLPFLYYGHLGNNRITMFIGISFMICGMVSSPILKFWYKEKNTRNTKD